MEFVQIIEMRTKNVDEITQLEREWEKATEGKRTATSVTKTLDRDRPETYLWIIEFPSYEEAMRNNELPETQEISREMMKLAEGDPTFRNLDVMEESAV